jgi:Holliday junction resolvasome RuvABC endonuclease subunit
MIFVGIDPGLTGAVAAIDQRGQIRSISDTPTIAVRKNGKSRFVYLESNMAHCLRGIHALRCDPLLVCIENVHSMPKQGVASSFSFGMGFGIWLGIAAALELPIERLEPKVWKAAMGIAPGSDKSTSIVRAKQLFPTADIHLAKHHGRADALLIAEWLRRKHTFHRKYGNRKPL